MEHVILVIHLILAITLIGLVLLQRSEGGGLGIGGSGGLGGLASAGSTANALTRMTAICAACFFTTSLVLGILAGSHGRQASLLDKIDSIPAAIENTEATEGAAAPATKDKNPAEIPSAPVE